jgi:2-amino-4-hydroxy-6-hydroxymethyldihydropteridine diphosphokinase
LETEIFIGLGSNLGDRIQNLQSATRQMIMRLGPLVKESSVYEAQPWGNANQPTFLNQVISVSTRLPPDQCLRELLQIERDLGRVRNEKWGPRTIDLDILYYGIHVRFSPELTIPHPEIANRKFILLPLAEIAPAFVHPVLLKTNEQLLSACTDSLHVIPYSET